MCMAHWYQVRSHGSLGITLRPVDRGRCHERLKGKMIAASTAAPAIMAPWPPTSAIAAGTPTSFGGQPFNRRFGERAAYSQDLADALWSCGVAGCGQRRAALMRIAAANVGAINASTAKRERGC